MKLIINYENYERIYVSSFSESGGSSRVLIARRKKPSSIVQLKCKFVLNSFQFDFFSSLVNSWEFEYEKINRVF